MASTRSAYKPECARPTRAIILSIPNEQRARSGPSDLIGYTLSSVQVDSSCKRLQSVERQDNRCGRAYARPGRSDAAQMPLAKIGKQDSKPGPPMGLSPRQTGPCATLCEVVGCFFFVLLLPSHRLALAPSSRDSDSHMARLILPVSKRGRRCKGGKQKVPQDHRVASEISPPQAPPITPCFLRKRLQDLHGCYSSRRRCGETQPWHARGSRACCTRSILGAAVKLTIFCRLLERQSLSLLPRRPGHSSLVASPTFSQSTSTLWQQCDTTNSCMGDLMVHEVVLLFLLNS